MGTSNWQNISFCIELIRRVNPRSILDVGLGFGRWGMLAREFLELWAGRVSPAAWQVKIDGVEAHAPSIHPYHAVFYNRIHTVDARSFFCAGPRRYDLVILGDVLEHLSKHDGLQLLHAVLAHADFALLNVPLGPDWPQGPLYGNDWERHLSVWGFDELCGLLPIVRQRSFLDYSGRRFATFLAASSPQIRFRFECSGAPAVAAAAAQLAVGEETRLAAHESNRLACIEKARRDWREMQMSGAVHPPLSIRSVKPKPSAAGAEVWILGYGSRALPYLDLTQLPPATGCRLAPHQLAAFGEALVLLAEGACLELPGLGAPVVLELLAHPYSGTAEITSGGRVVAAIDLHDGDHELRRFELDPATTDPR